MDENGQALRPAPRTWLKRTGIALGILVLLLLVFHRPILQTVGRRVAIHFAAKENLKVDFRLEGSIIAGLVLRNVHAVATGPSALQSADVDLVRVDYNLWQLMTAGMAETLKNVEVRNAMIVLDPAKAPPQIDVPEKDKKLTLPAVFPDRLVLSDINVRVASAPGDLLIEHLHFELFPGSPGVFRIAKLQLPNGRAWSNIAASTSYENRNLFLRDLVLDDRTQIRVVNLDASRVGANALDLKVEGTIAGARINGSVALAEKNAALGTAIDFVAEEMSLEALTRYIDPPDLEGADVDGPEIELSAKESVLRGDVRRLAIKGGGELARPKSWNGSVVGEIENLAAGGAVFDSATINISADGGVATIMAVELKRGASNITLRGTAELPETLDGFGRNPATIELRGFAPDLAAMTAGFAQPIVGSAEVSGRINIKDTTVIADLNLTGGPIDFGKGSVQKAIVNIRATKQMPPADQERPYFEGLTSEIGLDVTELRASGFAIDAVAGEVRTNGQNVTIEQLIVNRGDNRLALRAKYLLPTDFALTTAQPGSAEVSLVAANIGDYWEGDSPDRVTGALQLWGQADFSQGLGNGSFTVHGSDLRARKMVVQELSASGATAGNTVYLNDLTARLNERDYIRANGSAGINAPYQYSGALALNVADLSTFEAILKASGNKSDLAGALAVNWEGNGAISTFKNTGNLKLTLKNGRYANLNKLEANVDANYSPEELNVPIIYVSSDKLMFQAIMQAKGSTLEMTRIQIDQGQAKYAAGYVSVPFVWENLGTDKPLFPADGKVLVNFQTENLDINKLAKDFGQAVPVAGLANIKLDADGTLENLRANFDLKLTGLRSEKLEDFTPATFGLNARIENNQLVVLGKLEQSRIEPVQITANLPFDVAKIVENKGLDDRTPVTAKVQMPRSSVNFVRQFVPALQRVDGNMALDVNVGGTIANPAFSGSADMTINAARFSNPTLPALTNFNARLVFDGDSLNFPQFRGELAGGPFTISGQITFPKLTEPNFNLQLKADAVLVARNDDLTARVDADIKITGPLAGASVTGNVAITNSQFLKNIDLIPIGLPGRPAPGPKPPSASPDLSFPDPPLRDWKFDVSIKTKDPFLIRGNLANGGALVDMKLSGTGLEPRLDGSIRLQNVEATLPFSRLEIAQGFVYFNPDDPLNPGLDLQGTSLIRDYTIRVYIYGTANAPEAVFTSEPPLPQEEIISLLATGTTREELLGGGNVLAGRAVMLLGQQLYRKIFKKGQGAKSNSAFDRLDVDIGNVDPRTGQQTATARYRVTDQVLLVGDIGVQGDFRGTVKYLIRFR